MVVDVCACKGASCPAFHTDFISATVDVISLIPRLHCPVFFCTFFQNAKKTLGSGAWERG